MIAHIGIVVSDIERSKKFYSAALAPIGCQMIREYGVTPTRPAASAGFGAPPRAELWIYQGDPGPVTAHIAFQVGKRAMVNAFYDAAIGCGRQRQRQTGTTAAVQRRLLWRLCPGPGRIQYRSGL